MNSTANAEDFSRLTLLPQHEQLLADSAILADVAMERGYRSVSDSKELSTLGFAPSQCRTPGLLIPLHNTAGIVQSHQFRPDAPRQDERGRPVKYETPFGSRVMVDVPPRARQLLSDPTGTLWITEGSRKADSAVSHGLTCVSIAGVWNWRGMNACGGKTTLPDWDDIALNRRHVCVCFDSDVVRKPEVMQALRRLVAMLERRGARVWIAVLPDDRSR